MSCLTIFVYWYYYYTYTVKPLIFRIFRRYPLRRNTVHLNIPYYVKEKFESDYQGSLSRLESSVEEEYVAVMKQICFRERTYRMLIYHDLLPNYF